HMPPQRIYHIPTQALCYAFIFSVLLIGCGGFRKVSVDVATPNDSNKLEKTAIRQVGVLTFKGSTIRIKDSSLDCRTLRFDPAVSEIIFEGNVVITCSRLKGVVSANNIKLTPRGEKATLKIEYKALEKGFKPFVFGSNGSIVIRKQK